MKEYVPVRLNTIKAEKILDFEVYIRLPSKFLLYVHRGESLDGERIQRLKGNRVRKLFINSADEGNYQTFLDKGLEAAVSGNDMDTEERANLVSDFATDAVDGINKDPGSQKAYNATQKSAQSMAGALKKDPDVLKKIFGSAAGEIDEDASVESAVKCSVLTIKFCQALGFNAKLVEEVGTAALIRDIAIHQDLKLFKLFNRPYEQFGAEDWKIYKQHPLKGSEILEEKEYISKKILDLVATHEERKSGQGFPKGLSKLSPEQEVLGLVSAYDRLVTVNKLSPTGAMQSIRVDEVGNFDLKLIKKFVTLLKKEGLVE